jgi:hypothetical protein
VRREDARAKTAPARHERPPEREVSDDSCSRDACATVRSRLLPGRPHRHRRAEARALRGASYDAGVVDAGAHASQGKKRKAAAINWELLEKRIARSAEAYQRPVIRKKIVELIEYYNQCAEAGNLPAIPGAVLLVSEKRLDFNALGGNRSLGILHVPTEQGVLRALDGQHRLLALHQLAETRPVPTCRCRR